MPPPDHLTVPCRQFVLMREDIGRYSDLLIEAFPGMRFFERYPHNEEGPPDLAVYRSLRDFDGQATEIVFAAADWVPEWKRSERTGWWVLANRPGFNGRIDRGSGNVLTKTAVFDGRERTLEYLSDGRIYFRCRKWAPEELKAARKALRLLTKVATNKVAPTWWPSGRQPHGVISGDTTWCGHNALRWVIGHPDRRLRCMQTNSEELCGYRPLGA